MLLAIKFENQTKGVRFLASLSFAAVGILIAFRSTNVGADTANYYRMYSILANDIITTDGIEIGYIALIKILYRITDNPQLLFVIQGILVATSCYAFLIKNTQKVHEAYIAILSFLAFNLFSFHLSGVRQSIAMCICLFTYEKIKKKHFWRFLLIVGIASLFHMSAILFVPAYFIANIKENKARIWTILATIVGILWMSQIMSAFSLINDRFEKYGIEDTNNGYIFFAIVVVITAFDIVFQAAISKKTSSDAVHSKLNYCSAGMWLMRLFTRTIERISFFYLPSTMIVLAHTHGAMKTEKDRQLYTVILSILLIFLFLYRMRGWSYSFCQF